MRIYNTQTRQKDELIPQSGDTLKIYACGPTVYNRIHAGNARTLVVFDTLRRYLKYRGEKVLYIQNFTDVDDKIIRRAKEESRTPEDVASAAIADYFADAAGLSVLPADIHPKVTETMDDIIDTVGKLIERGFAYQNDTGVYFRVSKFPGYGKLSGNNPEELRESETENLRQKAAEFDPEYKEDPLDFAVWKAAKPGEPFWETPFGKGRPGWHIECSVMVNRYAGGTLDLHGGGRDLIFPHHENEIAQSESLTNQPLAHIWMHVAMLNRDGGKMSKSKGNFATVKEISEKYGYEPLRFLLLSGHYRNPLNYSDELILSAKQSLQRIRDCRDTLAHVIAAASDDNSPTDTGRFDIFRDRFVEVMDDDLNTADAFAVVFDLVREINILTASDTKSRAALKYALELFDTLVNVLGFDFSLKSDIPAEITALVSERDDARANKNFAKSDELRGRLEALGYSVKDTKQGTEIRKI